MSWRIQISLLRKYLQFGEKSGSSVSMNHNYRPLISVIVPCFNSGGTIKRTILSIKNQTWIQKEIILVNDGSTDELTINALKELGDEKIVKLINQKNNGLASARNRGVNESSGIFLFFLDADDWIDPQALEMLYLHLIRNKKYGYVFPDIYLEGKRRGFIENEFNLFEQFFLNKIPYCIFISKDTFIRYGTYDEDMKLGYEDWDLNIKLGLNKIFGKRLPLRIFHYDVQDTGMLLSKTIKKHILIWNSIKLKNSRIYKINNLISEWVIWRKKPSYYPLLTYFLWYLILSSIPEYFSLMLFLSLRNIKMFFRSIIFKMKIKN